MQILTAFALLIPAFSLLYLSLQHIYMCIRDSIHTVNNALAFVHRPHTGNCVQHGGFACTVAADHGNEIALVQPVSYTHLDVYKRQAQHSAVAAGRADCLCILAGAHHSIPIAVHRNGAGGEQVSICLLYTSRCV